MLFVKKIRKKSYAEDIRQVGNLKKVFYRRLNYFIVSLNETA